MKKVLWLIVCLMTMVINVNAQRYYSSYLYDVPLTYNKSSSYWDKQQMFSINATFGSVFKGDKSHLYYGCDFVIGGALMGLTLSDTSEGDDYNLTCGFQFGYFIPICGFGKKDDYRNGWENALLISPLIEFNQILNIDGHYLHENTRHHNCKAWIDTSYTTSGETGYGLAILYRFGCGNLILKATTTSVGASIGVGL